MANDETLYKLQSFLAGKGANEVDDILKAMARQGRVLEEERAETQELRRAELAAMDLDDLAQLVARERQKDFRGEGYKTAYQALSDRNRAEAVAYAEANRPSAPVETPPVQPPRPDPRKPVYQLTLAERVARSLYESGHYRDAPATTAPIQEGNEE